MSFVRPPDEARHRSPQGTGTPAVIPPASDGGGYADRADVLDVVFPLAGRHLPRDHAQPLADALGALLPWLAEEPAAGIHPVRLVPGLGPRALLSNRARVLLRVPRARAPALGALAGRRLDVGGEEVELGVPHGRELLAHSTLYAHSVAADSDDELAFMERMAQELLALGIRGHRVCGKHHRIAVAGRALDSFSLMLHGLGETHAMLLLQHGLGRYRVLGCGIFIPHRSAAAVGA